MARRPPGARRPAIREAGVSADGHDQEGLDSRAKLRGRRHQGVRGGALCGRGKDRDVVAAERGQRAFVDFVCDHLKHPILDRPFRPPAASLRAQGMPASLARGPATRTSIGDPPRPRVLHGWRPIYGSGRGLHAARPRPGIDVAEIDAEHGHVYARIQLGGPEDVPAPPPSTMTSLRRPACRRGRAGPRRGGRAGRSNDHVPSPPPASPAPPGRIRTGGAGFPRASQGLLAPGVGKDEGAVCPPTQVPAFWLVLVVR